MVGGAFFLEDFKMSNLDGAGDALQTLPDNDAPALPPGMTPEQAMLLRIVGEKADDINTFIFTLKQVNIVEEGELPPYNGELLGEASVLFKHAFALLSEAVGGSFAR